MYAFFLNSNFRKISKLIILIKILNFIALKFKLTFFLAFCLKTTKLDLIGIYIHLVKCECHCNSRYVIITFDSRVNIEVEARVNVNVDLRVYIDYDI
jgi:hypothetical protein